MGFVASIWLYLKGRQCACALSRCYVAYRTMKDSPFQSNLIHSIVFVLFNIFIGIRAYLQGHFYGEIGQLAGVSLIFGLTLLTGFILRTYFKVRELIISLITTLALFLFFNVLSNFELLAPSIQFSLIYFIVFELPRLGVRYSKNVQLNGIATTISGLIPFIILFHFLLLGIGLAFELPAIYKQWNFLIFGVPLLTTIAWLHLKQMNMSQLLTKSIVSLVIAASLMTFSTFGFFALKRSIGQSQLEESYEQYDEGNFDYVAKTTSEILEIDPYNANALFLSGCSLMELKDYKKANDKFFIIISTPYTGRDLTPLQNQMISYRIDLCMIALGTAKEKTIQHYSQLPKSEPVQLKGIKLVTDN